MGETPRQVFCIQCDTESENDSAGDINRKSQRKEMTERVAEMSWICSFLNRYG